jgi:hypothetical protein
MPMAKKKKELPFTGLRHVLARAEGPDGGFRVQVRRVAHVHHVNFRIGQEGIEAVVFFEVPQVHHLTGRAEIAADGAPVAGQFFRVTAAQGGDGPAFELAGTQVMDHAHEPDAHKSNSYHDLRPIMARCCGFGDSNVIHYPLSPWRKSRVVASV